MGGQKQPNDQESTHQQGRPDPGADIPNPNVAMRLIGTSHNDIGVPHPQNHALRLPLADLSDTHPHLQALWTPIPQRSGSTTPWVTLISTPNSENLEVEHGQMAHPWMQKDALLLCRHQWQSVHP